MATKKAGGTAKNLRDSNPKYLGIKITHGQKATTGSIILRQRGSVHRAGKNVGTAKDYTLFALVNGTVQFKNKRFERFDGTKTIKKQVSVL